MKNKDYHFEYAPIKQEKKPIWMHSIEHHKFRVGEHEGVFYALIGILLIGLAFYFLK